MRKALAPPTAEHYYYMDLLRIISALGVIAIHMPYWSGMECYEWRRDLSMSILNSFARFAVPIFFMLSGACNLNRPDFNLRKLFHKTIRLVMLLFFWSTLYGIIDGSKCSGSWREISYRLLFEHYHLWFIYVLVFIYLLIPLLNWIMQERKRSICGIALLLAGMCFAMAMEASHISILAKIGKVFDKTHIPQYSGYIFYFVVGYYLHKIDFSRIVRSVIYFAGCIGCVSTIILTAVFSQGHQYDQDFFRYQNPAILLWASAIFLWVKYSTPEDLSETTGRRIAWLGKATLGIYLSHIFCLNMLLPVFKTPFASAPFLTSLVFIPAIFLFALLITALLQKIKFLRKLV